MMIEPFAVWTAGLFASLLSPAPEVVEPVPVVEPAPVVEVIECDGFTSDLGSMLSWLGTTECPEKAPEVHCALPGGRFLVFGLGDGGIDEAPDGCEVVV